MLQSWSEHRFRYRTAGIVFKQRTSDGFEIANGPPRPPKQLTEKQGFCPHAGAMRAFHMMPAACLALAATAAGGGVAHADSMTIHLSGYVPERCSGSLILSGEGSVVKSGAIQTECNTAYSVEMVYPAELGPISVLYKGRTYHGRDGQVLLSARSEPSVGQEPVRIVLASAQAAAAPAAFAVVLSAQGL